MLKSTAVAASAATAAGIVGPTTPGAFQPYLCVPTLADPTGQAWKYDLTTIAASQNQLSGNGYNFDFAGCGISTFNCSGGVWNLAGKSNLASRCGDCNLAFLSVIRPLTCFAPVQPGCRMKEMVLVKF